MSAQDLKKPRHLFAGKLKTYAVAWIRGGEKISTQIDCTGGVNPTWNDKLMLRIEDRFLQSNTCALTVDIYCVGCIKNTLLGSVRVLISDLAKGNAVNFFALHVRRPSGRPQGILNIASLTVDEKNSGGVAHLHKGNIVYQRRKSEDSWASAIVPTHKSEAEGPEVESFDGHVKQGVGCYPVLRRKIGTVVVVYELER
ncbi:hypothetical protein SUGI_1079800 [Cryptomeria japonica]|nr:hypothetical protein SUGI_1079800 [Cryptomeria japonica]